MTFAATFLLTFIACAAALSLADSALRWADAFRRLPR